MMRSLKTIKWLVTVAVIFLAVATSVLSSRAQNESQTARPEKIGDESEGQRLFERETFGGNGRTCATCHSRETGTVSPEDAQRRFVADAHDPLFVHDGSDDGQGNGVSRMLADATVLVEIPLPANVRLADDPEARTVTLRRGIPSTLNTPALDPLLMFDGRHPDLPTQAQGAISAHYQNNLKPNAKDLQRIADFQQTDAFFSSSELKEFARGGAAPVLPEGHTESERRGRRFFVDAPPSADDPKIGSCAACHSGPMLNQTNEFLPLPVPRGSRFQNIFVSEFNAAGNPVRDFIFTNPDGSETVVRSPDPGRALITGDARQFPFDNLNAFKISSLRGVHRTAPYFHDNSAKTLEDVAEHYARFFALVTNSRLILTEQDKADIVAYLKLLQ